MLFIIKYLKGSTVFVTLLPKPNQSSLRFSIIRWFSNDKQESNMISAPFQVPIDEMKECYGVNLHPTICSIGKLQQAQIDS